MRAQRHRAVFFDVGETLIDESRAWAGWADWLEVPPLTLFAVLGGVIARGQHHHAALELLRPGFDFDAECEARKAAGHGWCFDADDLYPDVVDCLAELHTDDYLLGVAGNQPTESLSFLQDLGLPLDVVATSAGWGVEKPDPAFFERLALEADCRAEEVVYVGDRIDNDVVPARAAGMCAVHLRRGPWGYLQAASPEAVAASFCIDSLAELPAMLRSH